MSVAKATPSKPRQAAQKNGENMGNIVVGALIVIALLAAIFYMSTHGASGGCGGNCSGCGSFSSCHKPEKAEKKQ